MYNRIPQKFKQFQKNFQQYFPTKITATNLRTSIQTAAADLPPNERRKIAALLCHSERTVLKFYDKSTLFNGEEGAQLITKLPAYSSIEIINPFQKTGANRLKSAKKLLRQSLRYKTARLPTDEQDESITDHTANSTTHQTLEYKQSLNNTSDDDVDIELLNKYACPEVEEPKSEEIRENCNWRDYLMANSVNLKQVIPGLQTAIQFVKPEIKDTKTRKIIGKKLADWHRTRNAKLLLIKVARHIIQNDLNLLPGNRVPSSVVRIVTSELKCQGQCKANKMNMNLFNDVKQLIEKQQCSSNNHSHTISESPVKKTRNEASTREDNEDNDEIALTDDDNEQEHEISAIKQSSDDFEMQINQETIQPVCAFTDF